MTLLRDARQEIVWIGTDGQGLYQYTRNAVAFRSITFNDLPYNLSKPVRALYVDHERSLWVGTKEKDYCASPTSTTERPSTQPMSNRKPRPTAICWTTRSTLSPQAAATCCGSAPTATG